MQLNVGDIDRVLRIVVGVALIAFAVVTGNLLGWIGIVPLVTGIFKFCPAYAIFGIGTCKECKTESQSGAP